MNKMVKLKIYKAIFSIFFFLLLLTPITSMAYSAYTERVPTDVSQQLHETRITLVINNRPAKYILSQIEKMTGIGYAINSNIDAASLNNLSINVKNVTIAEALNKLFEGTGCTYEIFNNIISVVSKPKVKTDAKKDPKLTLTGIIIHKTDKTPVIGATIIAKATGNGMVSDVNGKFRIININAGSEFEVAYMGLKPQTLVVNDNMSNVVIAMETDALTVDDVVVTGIFTRKKESFTGSATTVTKKDLQRTGSQNVFQSLKNLDPTLNIMDNMTFGSDPNKMPDMELRGSSSFPDVKNTYAKNPNLPLFILDGFETTVEKVYDLDMNRIESVTILKDAAAKAIYGSKAANGVIVIETTPIQSGEFRVGYTGSLNMEMPDLASYDLCDSREKFELENALGFYNSSDDPLSDMRRRELYELNRNNIAKGVNTDWLSQPVRLGVGHKHAVNLEVGTKELRIGADLSYNNVQGVMKGSSRTAIGGGLTAVYRIKNLQFRNQLSFIKNDAVNSPYGQFSDYASLNPYWRPTDENGNYTKLLGYGPVFTAPVYNPLYNSTLNSKSTTEYFDITNNFYAEWNINSDFKLTGRLGITSKKSGMDEFKPGSHLDYIDTPKEEIFNRGSYVKTNGNDFSLSGDLNLNYNKTFGKHMLFGNAGLNISESTYENYVYSAQGFPNDKMDNIIFAKQYLKDQKPGGSESINREVGGLLVGNYSYDDRYLADASYRVTGSSQFGKDKRWGGFWSVGAGWNIHNEAFFKESNVVNQLRLRFSMGNTGSQNFNSYQSMMLYGYFANEVYLGRVGTFLEALANNDLQWQKKMDYNWGIDFKLWHRLEVRFDYYQSYTNDLLTDVTLPPSSGFSTYKANLGKIENKGYEFRLNYSVFTNVSETYLNIFATGAANNNKITEISNSLKTINSEQDGKSKRSNKPMVRFQEGESQNAIWAVRSLGINPESGKEIFLTKEGKLTDVWSVDDKVVCGNTQPKILGTFGFNFDRKGFGVSVTMRYRLGGQIYNQTLIDKVENAKVNGNVDRRALYDGWLKEDDHVLFRSIGDWNHPTLATSRFVQDLNELDISAISLSYDFYKHKFLEKCGLERLKVAINVNEVYKFSTVKIERGTSYPFARSLSFSAQINF